MRALGTPRTFVYLRRPPTLTTASKTLAGLFLAAALSAVVAAPGWAAPSGDEYLPKVPSATGHQSSAGGSQGESTVSTDAPPSTATDSTPSATQKSKHDGQQRTKSEKKTKTTAAIPAGSSDGGSSGGGSSMVPIILLIVAGVIVTVVGMTLSRRRGMQAEPSDRDGNQLERPNARPTPDGEIVAGGDEPA